MHWCGRCGAGASDGVPFCPRCGSNLGGPAPDSPYPAYPNGQPPYGQPPYGPSPYGPPPIGPPPTTGSGRQVAIVLSIVTVLVVVVGFVVVMGSSSRLTPRGAIPADPATPPGPADPTAPVPFADPGGAFFPTSTVMSLDARGAYELQAGGSGTATFAGYHGGHYRTWSDKAPGSLLRITILQFDDVGAATAALATIEAFWQSDQRIIEPFDALPGAMQARPTAASAAAGREGIHTVSFTKGAVLVVVRLSRGGGPTDDIGGVALAQYAALG